MKVVLEQHNPAWADQFQKVKASLEVILAGIPIVSIEHVGSTSVPGVMAKPVLDVDIIITLDVLDVSRKALAQAGYLDRGELGVPGRFMFRQPGQKDVTWPTTTIEGEEMRRNTYLMIQGSQALRNHLDLRRILLADEDLRNEYSAVKQNLAKRDYEHIDDYTIGKNEILGKILTKAGWTKEELAAVQEDS